MCNFVGATPRIGGFLKGNLNELRAGKLNDVLLVGQTRLGEKNTSYHQGSFCELAKLLSTTCFVNHLFCQPLVAR